MLTIDTNGKSIERERRWLLYGKGFDLSQTILTMLSDSNAKVATFDIEQSYLNSSKTDGVLRLRKTGIFTPDHSVVANSYCLTAKVFDPAIDACRENTTFCSEAIYNLLRPACDTSLSKTRLVISWHTNLTKAATKPYTVKQESRKALAIDTFHGSLKGLIIAEIEYEDGETKPELPEGIAWAGIDITGQSYWSNHTLAKAASDNKTFQDLLTELHLPS